MLNFEKNIKKIRTLCAKHNVEKLYLFGSATNDKFTEKSDIDFLVNFEQIELNKYFEIVNSPTSNYINHECGLAWNY